MACGLVWGFGFGGSGGSGGFSFCVAGGVDVCAFGEWRTGRSWGFGFGGFAASVG